MSNDDFPSLNSLSDTSPIVPSSSNGGKLSAAQMLSRAHAGTSNETIVNGHSNGDYTVDPFPPTLIQSEEDLNENNTTTNGQGTSSINRRKSVDISDESAFPSLGGASKKVGGTTWGSGGGSAAERVKQLAASSTSSLAPISSSAASSRSATPSSFDEKPSNSIYTTTFQIPTLSIQVRSLNSNYTPKPAFKGITPSRSEPEPSTVGEVMKFLMKKSPNIKVEASTSRSITTFIIKSKGINAEAEVEKAKRELLARLSKKVEIKVEIPAGLRPFVIGAKGKTLKEITESTGASVQVPNRDESAPIVTSSDSPDGPLISVTISGEQSGVALARAKILAIVNERASKVTSKVGVEHQFWIHLEKGLVGLLEGLAVENVEVKVPRRDEVRGILASTFEEKKKKSDEEEDNVVVVIGDASNVKKVVEAIQAQVEELKRNTKTITVSIAKRQHRCLVGKNADHVFEVTGCSVELPPVEESDENVTIRGPQSELVKALGLVMEVSNSEPIETLDLLTAHRGNHDTKAYSSHLTRYLLRKSKFQALSAQHSVQVYLPRATAIEAGTPLIEIVGKDAAGLAGARKDVIAIVRALPPANFWLVQVDSLNHRHLYSGKNGKKIKAMEEEKKVEVLFPEEGSNRNDILLVYSGEGAASLALASAISEINELAQEAATIKTSTLTIPNKLHKYIQGHNSTTLNAILGEERLSSVTFGAKGDDQVIVRGPEKDLARVVIEIERMAEEAKDAEVLNSHVIEFEVDTLQVRHVVGKAGAGINKLREELGVQVDFEELPVASTSGGKKAGIARSKVTIKGRKENCEAARKRITTVVDKMADEVTLTIPLPASIERGSIIGKQGTYLIRLETNYDVKINFPKAGKSTNDSSTAEKNEIVIRGPKKGAEAAKKELVDLMDYEKENGNVVTFTVVSKALPRILGKAGATINGIKEETGVNSIDVDQEEEGTLATITLKGTRTGTTKAKAMILVIAKEVEDEAKLTIEIPREYHTTLIGAGGASIRDLIARAGGPTDARGSGNAVRFPKQGDSLNTVTIVATKSVAEKIRKALEKELVALESRIVWGVAVASSAHAGIIGKGASALQELQRKFGVKVVVPGWNEYASVGEIINAQDVADAPEGDIVKILGPKEAAIACAEEISKNRPKSTGPAGTATIMVPRKSHASIAQGGRFFRSLPRGTKVTHDGAKLPSNGSKIKRPSASTSSAGRIDDTDTGMDNSEGEKIDFQLVALSSEEEEGEIPWVINSASQADADKTVAEIEKALAQTTTASHYAWVTLPAGFMPRVVGRGGAGLDKLRSAGVEVEVVGRRESNELTLVGSPENIEVAHQMLLALAAPRPPRQQRERDDRDY